MRGCGVLLHISSLPGKGGVGTLGADARAFVDFLAAAGQSWWQVLPLTPPAKGDSPYSAYSVFAGNPAFINLELLESEGLLAFWTRKFLTPHRGERANYNFCRKVHMPLLRQSFRSGFEERREEVDAFRRKHSFWIEDYALYMAIRESQEAPLMEWPEALRLRDADALRKAAVELRGEVDFHVWTQYLFFRQWDSLHAYAKRRGVGIVGDMPLYPAMDSADLWANPSVFQLDSMKRPIMVAGVPPDPFTADGQLWGNPLYDWTTLKLDGYHWWMKRLELASDMYDRVRIDHFRGLDEYYAVPVGEKTARKGVWKPGPGLDFVRAVSAHLPDCDLIAEDLGYLTDSVHELLRESGLPGMKILQFAFDPTDDSDYLPHNFVKNSVGYTGTHDNDTVMGWVSSAKPDELRFARRYLGLSRREGYHWGFIRGLYATSADTAIVPMQDFLGLGSSSRMNIPGDPEGQWGWRLDGRVLTDRLSFRMRELAETYRRRPEPVREKSSAEK